jgi:hypothetical protein
VSSAFFTTLAKDWMVGAKQRSTVPPGAMSEVFAEWLMARVVSRCGWSSR